MQITLISPYPDITAIGVRSISAYLKDNKHKVRLVFMPDPHGDNLDGVDERYDRDALDDLCRLCEGSDLIGISLMTNFFEGARQITSLLKKKLSIPIIWGGVHPTIRPEECLEFADIVCRGEAEDSLLQLMDRIEGGEEYLSTENFWFNSKAGIVKNQLSPLPKNLDQYPSPDYSCDDHHLMLGPNIVALTHEIMHQFLAKGTVSEYLGRTGYQTMTSRGCPYNCSYCINHTIMQMYGAKGKLRWRSVDKVMEELEWVVGNMEYVDYIWISDDEFMARKTSEIEYFCQEYKKRINLPFSCLVSAISISEEKMRLLVDAGLIYVQMGVESGSARMQKIFKRPHINNERMLRAIAIINFFKSEMFPPSYDFLLDAPGETDQDRLESLRFIIQMPKPFKLQTFALVIYPGTHLYNQAMERGEIIDERKEIYNKTYSMYKKTYLNSLFAMAKGGKCPSWIIRLLISYPVLTLMNSRLMRPLINNLFYVSRAVFRASRRILV